LINKSVYAWNSVQFNEYIRFYATDDGDGFGNGYGQDVDSGDGNGDDRSQDESGMIETFDPENYWVYRFPEP
jgi:hypothetical protein